MDDPAKTDPAQSQSPSSPPVTEEVVPPLPEPNVTPPPPVSTSPTTTATPADSSPFASAPSATSPSPTEGSPPPSTDSVLAPEAAPSTSDSGSIKPERKINKKVVGGLVAILFLTIGTIAGVYTVQNNRQAEKSLASEIGGVCPENPSTTIAKCARFLCPQGCGSDGQCLGTDPGALYFDDCNSLGGACGQVDYLNASGNYCSIKENTCTEARCTSADTTTPTAPPLAICGETCTTDSECAPATHPGVGAVVCREGQCVSQTCYDTGSQTNPGTLCTCAAATGECGAECGTDIGLCASGLSCTYASQSQCNPANRGICVPNDVATSTDYDGVSFTAPKCGPTTVDPDNSFISHPSFPNHTFTTAEVTNLICNPAPSPSPDPDIRAACLDIRAYQVVDSAWNLLTIQDLAALTPGTEIIFVARGQAPTDNSKIYQKARFTINSGTPTETTTTMTEFPNNFYIKYTIPSIPAGTSQVFSISTELFHPDAGWF